ncbi:hypothetical protein [Endozoicomonas sp. ONNA2]|nr:hypothetical protein [Endozoicomonas sp. ONNA2]
MNKEKLLLKTERWNWLNGQQVLLIDLARAFDTVSVNNAPWGEDAKDQ